MYLHYQKGNFTVTVSKSSKRLENTPFTIMVNESTDVACTKHLCICIKYFNSRSNEITSQFLGLIPVIDTTADVLYEHVKHFLMRVELI